MIPKQGMIHALFCHVVAQKTRINFWSLLRLQIRLSGCDSKSMFNAYVTYSFLWVSLGSHYQISALAAPIWQYGVFGSVEMLVLG